MKMLAIALAPCNIEFALHNVNPINFIRMIYIINGTSKMMINCSIGKKILHNKTVKKKFL